jgi:membrane-bound serine protease (ClpP class)
MTPLSWAVLALVVGLIFVMAEVFIPSGGILGFLAAGCLLLSVVLAFNERAVYGFAFLLVICLLLPVAIGVAFHYWPRTPFGKRLFLAQPTKEQVDPETERTLGIESLRGETGRTLTALRPSGLTDFGGRRIDTVTEGGMIDRGELVRVISVHGNRVVVRLVEAPQDGEANAIDTTPPVG